MKIIDFFKKDVHIKKSHLWMVGLGTVIGLGFFVNCVIEPFFHEYCRPVDWEQLVLSAVLLAGLGTVRKVVLARFKYLNQDFALTKERQQTIEQMLKEKIWVPCIGWFLVAGFAINFLVAPFYDGIHLIDWEWLQTSIALFLSLSGAREFNVYSQNEKQALMEQNEVDTERERESLENECMELEKP